MPWGLGFRLHLLHPPGGAHGGPGGHQRVPGGQDGCGHGWQVLTLRLAPVASFLSERHTTAMFLSVRLDRSSNRGYQDGLLAMQVDLHGQSS